jgi:hypothetical protein
VGSGRETECDTAISTGLARIALIPSTIPARSRWRPPADFNVLDLAKHNER